MIRIFNIVIPARIITLLVAEIAAIMGCFFLAATVDPDITDFNTFLQFDSGAERIAIVTAMILTGMFLRNLYSRVRISSRFALIEELFVVFGFTVIGQGIVDYAAPQWTVPRKVMLGGGLLALAAICALRLMFDSAARETIVSSKLLFLGRSATVDLLAARFAEHPEDGWSVVGYLETDSTAGAVASEIDIPRLGSMRDLDDVIEEHHSALIVIARRSDIRPSWTEEFLELRFGGVQAEEAAALYEKTFGRVCTAEIWPHKLLFSSSFDPDPLDARLREAYSLALSTVLTLLALAPMLLIAILLALGSSGPILIRERRLGLHDRPFDRHRFRCRRASGEPTPLGRFLLNFGLDGLPGLFDVLRGKMALVGPRGERPEYSAALAAEIPFYRQRNRVKPGLTGWEQIHAEPGEAPDAIARLEYDLYYARNLSLSLDTFVLVQTLRNIRARTA
jgi:lipopolysaccharide/colanic/teichoic acid biosynthesis glycosyltransferase